MTDLSPGDKLPPFNLPASNGQSLTDGDFRGAALVLYFYPRDDTPGCTKEAIGFTQFAEAFEKAGAKIVGVSKDSAAKHDKFTAKHGLGIALLSDEHGDLCERMGVWVEKQMYGKSFMGIERATFLFDETGALIRSWRKVKVPGHVESVLEAIQAR